MLRPETARLFTTMLLWNWPSNSVAQPTGQVELGLAMVESPAIQTLVVAAATVAGAGSTRTLQPGGALIAAEAAPGAAMDSGVTRAATSSRRTLRMVPPVGTNPQRDAGKIPRASAYLGIAPGGRHRATSG